MPIIYKLIKSQHEFSNLESSWSELEVESKSIYPSLSFKWCYLWWDVFKNVENNSIGFNKELNIVCGYQNDKLILVAPLIRLKRGKGIFKITFLEFLGQQWGSISLTVLRRYDFDYASLVAFVKRNIDYHILYLRQIPTSESNFYLQEIIKYSGSPYVNLTDYDTFEDFRIKNYSKSLKQNLRTAFNRINKDKLIIEVENKEINDIDFNDIVRLSKMKLIDEKQCLYNDVNKSLFYYQIYLQFSSSVVFVKLSNNNIAYRANIFYNNQKTCIDASYDRNYKKYDPGIISVDYNFIDSFSNKLDVENLGPGLDDYKLKFTKKILYLGYIIKVGNFFGSIIVTNIFKKYLNTKR